MTRICLDASVVIRFVAEPDDSAVQRAMHGWMDDGVAFVAPSLQRYEITNALYRYLKYGASSVAAIETSLDAALAIRVELIDDEQLHRDALRISSRHSLRASYDATYLALAERLGVEFWTTDQRLVNSVRSAMPWARLVGE